MKLIDKLKNALFEEEYVEVEEKPKKVKTKKEAKPIKKEVKSVKKEVVHEEEKPIAKKIVPPEKKEAKITHHEEEKEIENKANHHEGEALADEKIVKSFPFVSDSEFREEKIIEREEPPRKTTPRREEVKAYREEPRYKEPSYEKTSYEEPHYREHKKAYGMDDLELPESMYGAYEKKEERTYFKPSPIISPIYGVLDKNYTKEELQPKREIRLTSTYSRENLDFDEVRQRAFGTHEEEEIKRGPDLEDYDIEEESNFVDNDLLDLSEEKPEVRKVTVGDAEEYFEDLGLEYNVDYKDASKDTRTPKKYEEIEEEPEIYEERPVERELKFEEEPPKKEIKEVKEEKTDDPLDEDNLFDLIDSMYENE